MRSPIHCPLRSVAAAFFPLCICLADAHAQPIASATAVSQPGQISIQRVETMPRMPSPYRMRDWKQVARDYDRFVYDRDVNGQYLPICWTDKSHVNVDYDVTAIPSYVGHPKMRSGPDHEGITNMAAVLGASMVGIDKTNQQGLDFVRMAHSYFNSADGENLYLNRLETHTGQTFWYELYPNILAWQLHAAVPKAPGFNTRLRMVSDSLLTATRVLAGGDLATSIPDFTYTAFDFRSGKPVSNGQWLEPDGAAAFAWMLLMARQEWPEEQYLAGADAALRYLDALPYEKNPHYEVLLPFGAVTAARLNAESGRRHDLHKFLCWFFGQSDARPGFGVIADGADGHWGDHDCHGLVGSITDGGGYVFAMNSYADAATLTPVARYDDRYARAIGRWLLNLANASSVFYGDGLPADRQTCYDWLQQHDTRFCVGYEGVRANWKGVSPRAMGDPLIYGWANTDLGLYGSSHVGLLGALVDQTSTPGILRVDMLATDWFHGPAYPSYLFYNPHRDTRRVPLSVGPAPRDLYDPCRNGFVAKAVSGDVNISIPPDSAVEIVMAPAGGALTREGNRTLIDGVTVDYNNEVQPLPPPRKQYDQALPKTTSSSSRVARAAHSAITIDGNISDWSGLSSDKISMHAFAKAGLAADIQFAWDKQMLYMLVRETARDTTVTEARDRADYSQHFWAFDGVSLFLDLANRNLREDVKDLNLWYGFSSSGRSDLFCARSHREPSMEHLTLPAGRVATAGRASDASRVIEAAIAWDDIARTVSAARLPRGGMPDAVKTGYRFGCEPLLLDECAGQAFLNGTQNALPRGDDAGSLDIVLGE